MKNNNNASMIIFRNELSCQIRIEDHVYKVPVEESDSYFNSRPREARLAALASKQSKVLESRHRLKEKVKELKEKFKNRPIPRPANWGGFYLSPDYFEFWQGGSHQLHDRIVYKKIKENTWKKELLYP